MTNTDPWALLREARDRLSLHMETYFSQQKGSMFLTIDLVDRIDAALAGRAEGSTEGVVESDPWWSIAQQRANEGRYEMIVWRRSLSEWCWDVHVFGQRSAANGVFTTEAEAKSAAIAAAKGMR